jgi:hypothetical protein
MMMGRTVMPRLPVGYDRISVSYPHPGTLLTNLLGRPFDISKNCIHNFIDDVRYALFPYRRIECQWAVIENGLPQLRQVLIKALSGRSTDIREALSSFVQGDLGYNLLFYQRACFEIVRSSDNTVILASIPPYTYVKLFGIMFQYLPKHLREDHGGRWFLYIPREKIIEIGLPQRLRRLLRVMMFHLSYLSEHTFMPKFVRDEGRALDLLAGRFPVYNGVMKAYLAHITREIGWNGRRTEQDELEYYNVVRFLRFEQFKLDLRNCIIDGLNRGIRKIATRSEPPIISLDLFPDQAAIDTAVVALRDGTKKLDELIKPFTEYS